MGINKGVILLGLGRTSYPPRRKRATSDSLGADLADKLANRTPPDGTALGTAASRQVGNPSSKAPSLGAIAVLMHQFGRSDALENRRAILGFGDDAEEWLKNQCPEKMRVVPRLAAKRRVRRTHHESGSRRYGASTTCTR